MSPKGKSRGARPVARPQNASGAEDRQRWEDEGGALIPLDEDPQWLSRRQAAATFGIPYDTVREWERRGLIRSRRVAGSSTSGTEVSAEDVGRLAAERRA